MTVEERHAPNARSVILMQLKALPELRKSCKDTSQGRQAKPPHIMPQKSSLLCLPSTSTKNNMQGCCSLTLPLQTERTHSMSWPVSSWKARHRFISWSHSFTAPPSLVLKRRVLCYPRLPLHRLQQSPYVNPTHIFLIEK